MELRNPILATLSYYDGFDWPLTSFEVWQFLIRPERLGLKTIEVSLAEVVSQLEKLVSARKLTTQYGLYMLSARSELAQARIGHEKIAAQKWKKFLRRAQWLQLCPWVEGFFASGSLALGNMDRDSDFDILMIIRPGRLYLGRLFVSGLTSLLGVRRTRFERVAPDKLCFNHFITRDALHIHHESLFNAQSYAHLVSVYMDKKLTADFFAANVWINVYLARGPVYQETVRRMVVPNRFLGWITRGIERVIDHTGGDALERATAAYQQNRIVQNPATHAAGGRVVYTDTELEFHPRSFERVVLEQYNQKIYTLHLAHSSEKDSGLA